MSEEEKVTVHAPEYRKELRIVVREAAEGFTVTLEGDIHCIGKIPEKDLSLAEFWGLRLFNLCGQALHQSGAVKEEMRKQ